MAEIVGIEDNRFAPTKTNQEDSKSADRVKMGAGIESKSTLNSGSRVAKMISHPSVGKLVDGDGDN